MNAEYCGTYLLTEKIEMGENRVAVRDLEKAIKDINPDLDFDALEPLGDLESAPGAYKYRSLPAVPPVSAIKAWRSRPKDRGKALSVISAKWDAIARNRNLRWSVSAG